MENTKEAKKTYYDRSPEEIYQIFSSSETGLSEDQIEKNRSEYGANKLQEAKKKGFLAVFLGQFKDLLVIILIIAALISAATGDRSSTIVILAVLILNAVLGTVQYFKAQKSLESLKKLSSPQAKAIRGGKLEVIPAEDLVCGDIITLDAGDIVPGDARLLESYTLKTNESSLTGESLNAEKSASFQGAKGESVALGDQKNMVFSGTLVTYGRAKAIVTSVGTGTELGRIAQLMNDTGERKTPLQVTMDNFSRKLSAAIMVISFVVFLLEYFRGFGLLPSLLFAVALAVAAIPEALASIITISLAIGTGRMAEQNAIIKDLNAVEGLGCVSVICSDKTGTLTQNKMTVEYTDAYAENGRPMLLASVLCNDSKIADGEYVGDPTESAFLENFIKLKGRETLDETLSKYPRLAEVPFDSDRKLMSTLHYVDGKYIMFTKGAIDVILGSTYSLTEEEKKNISDENFDLSNHGLRILGFAMKEIGAERSISPEDEGDFTYLGLMAEMDPPREESMKAVSDCIAAGIKPIMITGDHKVTASAIAKRIGILREGDLAVTGPELDQMSEEELNQNLEKISVYARVSPDNKIRIVQAWQSHGHIVAMTGDGVNDGPALKSADVGIAMGITGTEVAKDSASMILTDDNFATIVKAVLNGRGVYNNIKNAIRFLLSGNAAAIAAVLFTSLLGLPLPFTAVQLLFINLITDSLPALSISMEPLDKTLLNDKPRKRTESVLNKETLKSIGGTGLLISIATILAYFVGLGSFPWVAARGLGAVGASTMAFSVLCLARLFHGFNCRGREDIFRLGFFSNVYTIGAFVLGAVLLHLILLLPFFHTAFGIAPIDARLLLYVWILAFLPTLIIQIGKRIRYRSEK